MMEGYRFWEEHRLENSDVKVDKGGRLGEDVYKRELLLEKEGKGNRETKPNELRPFTIVRHVFRHYIFTVENPGEGFGVSSGSERTFSNHQHVEHYAQTPDICWCEGRRDRNEVTGGNREGIGRRNVETSVEIRCY